MTDHPGPDMLKAACYSFPHSHVPCGLCSPCLARIAWGADRERHEADLRALEFELEGEIKAERERYAKLEAENARLEDENGMLRETLDEVAGGMREE